MIDNIFIDTPWIALSMCIILLISDYYLSIFIAKRYKLFGKKYIDYEGGIELEPQYQDDVENYRLISKPLIFVLLMISITIPYVWFSGNKMYEYFGRHTLLFTLYPLLIGFFILIQLTVHIWHLKAFVFYRSKNISAFKGKIKYKRWFLWKLKTSEFLGFTLLYLIIGLITNSWFLYGGAFGCFLCGLRFWYLNKKAQKEGIQYIKKKFNLKKWVIFLIFFIILLIFHIILINRDKPERIKVDISSSNPSNLKGVWVFKKNPSEHHGIKVYDFQSDGSIICHKYPMNWKPGMTIKPQIKGWWKKEENIVWLKFPKWKHPYNYYFTKENVLVPVNYVKNTSWRLFPAKITHNGPKILDKR